jgi:Ca-activated chloride channel family protein
MFRFENPEFLYLFIAMPFVVAFYIRSNIKKRKDVEKLGTLLLLKQMMPDLSLKRSYLKFWLIFAALCAGIFMVARPQFGTKLETVEKKGIELVIAIDVSNSMLARDVAPDRLTRAKQILTRIIDERKEDQVALIVFAGEAFVQMPLTSDTQSAKLFLNSIDPGLVPVQGTAIADAIQLGMNSFSSEKNVGKAMIIITDGEDHEGNAMELARKAAEQGIMVNVVGIGTPEGAPIPESINSGNFKTDNEGNVVVSRLNEQMCKEIAQNGKGVYVRADNTTSAIRALKAELDKLQKKESTSVAYSEYDEKYSVFAWILFVLLIIEILIYDKKNPLFKNVHIFK